MEVVSGTWDAPDFFQEEFNGHHRIEAGVGLPDQIRQEGFRNASAVLRKNNPEEILPLFAGYAPREVTGEEYEGYAWYEGTNGFELLVTPEGGNVTASGDRYDYIRMAYHADERTEDYNRDIYSETEELEDFSRADCRELVKRLCRGLGVGEEYEAVCRKMDYRVMEEEAVQYNIDGTDQKPDYRWSEEDSGYFCSISQLCNGVPLIQSNIASLVSSDILCYSGVECYVTKNQIDYAHADAVFELSYESGYAEPLPFTRIVELYREKTELMPQISFSRITGIELRALAVQGPGGRYSVEPVWFFAGYMWAEGEEAFEEYPFSVGIHAVTGEEL
ncbi:MAG: hypothetical protein Q4C65_05530 [Eubacteriales bacterium]|nr:hypothetical protein [Eubacteriales bacterium]